MKRTIKARTAKMNNERVNGESILKRIPRSH